MDAGSRNLVRLDSIEGLNGDIELYVHDLDSDLVSRKIQQERCWEPYETEVWLAAQRAGDVVLDVGANLGYFSILSAKATAPAQQVFAFEPAADNYALLIANLERNLCQHAVIPVNAALGATASKSVLHRSEDNKGDHQLYAGDGERQGESVEVVTGADYLAGHFAEVNLVKIDTQGTELAVLQGLHPILKRSLQLRMLIELTPFSLRLAGASGRALIEFIADLGLPLAIVDHMGRQVVPTAAEDLAQWCDDVDSQPGDRGFMNIFAGTIPESL